MASEINDGGPAFPTPPEPLGEEPWMPGKPGNISVRDWFAGQAIPAAVSLWEECDDARRKAYSACVDSGIIVGRDYPNFIKNISYSIADAMLSAREQKGPK